MISDKERREVAKKLREYPERIGLGDLTDGELLDVIAADVGIRASCSDFDAKLMDRLADLINRPTTHLTEDKDGRTCCASCGCPALYMSEASYCPDCGADVVGDE